MAPKPTQQKGKISRNRLVHLILCAVFAALMTMGAYLRIPFPLVPLSLQTLFVLLAGLLLGKKWGCLSALLYLCIGLIGLPVFTEGGGFSYVLKPTFGYIAGFCGGAWLAGLVSEKFRKQTFWGLFAACLPGLALIYLAGVVYCYGITNLYLGQQLPVAKVLVTGVLVCLPGDLLCALAAAGAAVRLKPALQKFE